MIAGGAEATITPMTFAGFSSMKAMSTAQRRPLPGASRPFSGDRDGFVMGEGGGAVVLESLEHAEARGATILGEVVGYGLSADAHHITAPPPDGSGAQAAMRMAMKYAGASSEDVDYVNAHGTSTMADAIETEAIKAVLGDRAYEIVVGSTKSMTGHLLGAAGALEAIVSLMACRTGKIPPTIIFRTGSGVRSGLRAQRHGRASSSPGAHQLLRFRRTQRLPGTQGLGLSRVIRPLRR